MFRNLSLKIKMKIEIFFLIFLFSSCSEISFSGYVYDYDKEKPIKDVQVKINGVSTQTDSIGYFTAKIKSNTDCVIELRKEDYASKKLYRKPDSIGMFSKRNLKKHKIYLFKKESDFSNYR